MPLRATLILTRKFMRIFKNKAFHKWTKEQDLDNSDLVKVAEEMQEGLYEVNLGGSIYKKRVSIGGKRKRGGARVIVAFKLNEIIIFIYGFPKKEKGNITNKEKEALKALAKVYLAYTDDQLDEAVNTGAFIEVMS